MKESVKICVSSELIINTLSGHEKSFSCALISFSLSVIEGVPYLQPHKLIFRYSGIYLEWEKNRYPVYIRNSWLWNYFLWNLASNLWKLITFAWYNNKRPMENKHGIPLKAFEHIWSYTYSKDQIVFYLLFTTVIKLLILIFFL